MLGACRGAQGVTTRPQVELESVYVIYAPANAALFTWQYFYGVQDSVVTKQITVHVLVNGVQIRSYGKCTNLGLVCSTDPIPAKPCTEDRATVSGSQKIEFWCSCDTKQNKRCSIDLIKFYKAGMLPCNAAPSSLPSASLKPSRV